MRKLINCLFVIVLSFGTLHAQLTRTVCASGCDFTTIQAAVNAAVIGDNISIQDPVHTENSILITKNVNICGGSPGTILQASTNGTGNFRIFNIQDNSLSVTINDLILQNGNLQSNLLGGAILNAGTLTLVNCTLRNNDAHRGGAIASSGVLTLINSTVSGNSVADQGMNRASGGGIYAGGTCTLINSTVSGNSNNTSGAGEGGGITILNSSALILIHATIANNSIGGSGVGAGLSVQANSSISLANTIIADNTGAADFNNGSALLLVDNSTNIIPSCTGSCATFITDDPVLLPLADNGGCTRTHDLGVASAAINAGTISPVTMDQRGAARSAMEPDIGAVELSATVPACLPVLLCEDLLPVEYLSFTASAGEQSVVLDWVTAVEINNEGFEIERSADGLQWDRIGFLSGEGTKAVPTAYQYIDPFPYSGTNYYRLKQIDHDGHYAYSAVLSVALSSAGSATIRVFPNPATEILHVQLPEAGRSYRLQLFNSLGQLVWERLSGESSRYEVPLATLDLASGTYWLSLSPAGAGAGEQLRFRVLLQAADGR